MDEERASDVTESVASRRAREDVLRRLYALPWADRHLVWKQLSDDLAGGGEPELRVSSQVSSRAEAADCVRAAAQHVGVEPGSLTGAQYDAAAETLAFAVSRQQVIRTWGTWRLARDAARGADVPATVEQRAQRRARGGRGRTHDEHLASLRAWMAASSDESRTNADYDAWVRRHNERAAASIPLPLSGAVRNSLCVPWPAAVEVARGSSTLDEARAGHLAALIRAAGDFRLISVQGIALVTGTSAVDAKRLTRTPGYPVPALRLGPSDAWYVDDVRQHHATGTAANRERFELQDTLLDSAQLNEMTGLNRDNIIAGIHREQWAWVPRPAGKVGHQHFWRRDSVVAWVTDRDARRG